MKTRLPAKHWLFPVEEAPVFVAVGRGNERKNIHVPSKKAIMDGETGRVIGIVGQGYKVFTNQQAIDLCQTFCREAFPDTAASEWVCEMGDGPGTRSWAALDIRHRTHTMNLMAIEGGPSDTYTPFARITNSYNGSRALRIDIGFMRKHCENGIIFEEHAAKIRIPHTREGIHSLKIASPFKDMAELCGKFSEAIQGVRNIAVTPDEAGQLVRQVIGWPGLAENAKPAQRMDQAELDADLDSRLRGYLKELGANAYAAFNTMTDIAARPPESNRFRRDRPGLERRAGAWLRDFRALSTQPGFTIPGHLKELAVKQTTSRLADPRREN